MKSTEFLEYLNEELLYSVKENKIINIWDVPFIMSVIHQEINKRDSKINKTLMNNIRYAKHCNIVIKDTLNDYNGICDISIYVYNDKNYEEDNNLIGHYKISIYTEERYDGYCQCTPDMNEYRGDKGCCGISCDWNAPAFTLEEIINVCDVSYDGLQRDYWDYENRYYKTNEKLKKKKEQDDKENKIKNLINTIEKCNEELKRLQEEE